MIQTLAKLNLETIVEYLHTCPNDYVIYLTTPSDWTGKTPAKLLPSNQAGKVQIGDLTYFLEVPLAKEIVSAWKRWHPEGSPTLQDKVAAVIHYAVYDA